MRVLTMGTFDLLHPGHLQLFRWCRRLAGEDGEVWVTVNSDEFVERYKGRRPVMADVDRIKVIRAIEGITQCRVHGDRKGLPPGIPDVPAEDASETIDMVFGGGGGVIVIGADWRDRDYLGQLGVTQGWLDERGIVVVYVPLLAGHSSTALREAMA